MRSRRGAVGVSEPAARVKYRELPPHASLAPFVRCYWVLVARAAAPQEPVVECVYPDGCAELIFHRGDRFEAAVTDVFECQSRALVFGQLEQRVRLRRPPRVETIGVRFHHAGMAPLLGVAAAELTGRWEPFDAVGGAWARRLVRRVGDADDPLEAIRIIDASLVRRAAVCSPPDALIEGVIDVLTKADGTVTVAELAGAAGIGVRRLQRRFARHVGVPPKRLAGILRLQEAFSLLGDGASPPLVDVAHRCGYFDQSHFIRDFRRVTGLPPGRFWREEGGMARLFVAG